MTLVRWEPTRDITSLQGEMNRLFSSFFEPGAAAANGVRWVPPMDLVETEDGFRVKADLPGLTDEDVHVEVEDGVLTVSGERRSEQVSDEGGVHRVERAYGQFRRSLTLPDGVDPEQVQANIEHGVLEIRIPKPAARIPHRVPVSRIADDAA